MARVEMWLYEVFKVNPHSLRYAFIRHLTLGGSSIEEIAKGLGLREPRNVKEILP